MFPTTCFPSFEAVRLTSADAPRLQRFLMECEDYFLMISGEAAGPQEAEEELLRLPPGKSLDDKVFMGLQEADGRLAGVFDVVKDYPEPGIWYLGLLLLHPAKRSQGHGEAIHAQLCACIRSQGGSAIRLGVVERNESALRFWTQRGYRELERKPFQAGRLTHTVRVMQMEL